jgi:hypothetical protein
MENNKNTSNDLHNNKEKTSELIQPESTSDGKTTLRNHSSIAKILPPETVHILPIETVHILEQEEESPSLKL